VSPSNAERAAPALAGGDPIADDCSGENRSPDTPSRRSKQVAAIRDVEFVWRGLSLHLGRRSAPVLTLVADPVYPHLFRIRYPNGWTSLPANLTRAKDAAYGHARYLLHTGTPEGPRHAAESPPGGSEGAGEGGR
jgi:hypothetical protein